MKLIIDIDEDYYNIIQKNGGNNYVEDAVLNGTPLEDMKAEIVSRASIDGDDYHNGFNFGLMTASQIMDKHIRERSNDGINLL